MAVAVPTLLQDLQRLALLEPAHLAELVRRTPTEPRALGRLLLDRGWLTAYQVNQLLLGRGAELRLGSYVIRERLPAAPAGEVYVARHLVMRRLAEIVVVRAELLAQPEAVAQFYEEVQAVSRLCAPHLVAAYDAGPAGDSHFVALEHVEGGDLQTLVQRDGPRPVEEACACVEQAALGLQHAWERGLLHHDLRPCNLLRTPAGVIKVRNLGLTILSSRRDQGAPADWLAPECRSGQPGDIRAVLYSLGGVLHFLLIGQAPGDTPARLDALRGDVPEALTLLCARLLAAEPAQRCQTPAEVSAALQAIRAVPSWQAVASAADAPVSAALRQARRQQARRQWQWISAGAAGLLAGLLLFGWLLSRQLRSGMDHPAPLTLLAPSVPGPPALVLQCGQGNGSQQAERQLPGYTWRLVQGDHFDAWGNAPKRHCWYHKQDVRFELAVPAGTAGLLRLYCLDGDTRTRRQNVYVQGKLLEQLEGFSIPGRTVETTLTAADTRDGTIDVRIENLNADINAVVSTVEFLPLIAVR